MIDHVKNMMQSLDTVAQTSIQQGIEIGRKECAAKIAELERARAQYKRVGWAQEMANGKLLFMETNLPKESLHDNGRPMHQLYILSASRAGGQGEGK